MSSKTGSDPSDAQLGRVLDVLVRVALIALIALWCFQIVRPFLVPVIWGGIIAVAAYPVYVRLLGAMGGRDKLASVAFAACALVLLLVPTSMLSGTLVDTAQLLYENVHAGQVEVPPPPQSVAEWPLVGERVHALWTAASEDLSDALEPFTPQLKSLATGLLATAASTGIALVQWVFSIVIAGVLLANAEAGRSAVATVATRVAGDAGRELSDLSAATVRSVATGVVGVAIIQALLAGVGMLLAGVPGAGLWTLIILVLAVAQLPPLIVLGPVAVYLFTGDSRTVAVLFAVWALFVSVSDTFLKPMLLGRGSPVPTLVIFIGALGGMMWAGILGLFVGAVILTLGYTLFTAWTEQSQAA